MANVFSNASFAVLSVMSTTNGNTNAYIGSTCFVQRKPESDYGNITIISYPDDDFGTHHNLRIEDFNQQAAFEANVVPKIHSDISSMSTTQVNIANSNISSVSYSMNGTAIT